MTLTAHQPVYLPWLGLFEKIARADTFVLYDDVQYLPRDWMNRNRVKTSHGPRWLTVPVLRRGHRDKPTTDIEIDNRTPWRRKHWKTLRLSYAKAPYFDAYAGFFEATYARDWTHLADLNDHVLRGLLDLLGIRVHYLRASDLGLEGTGSDRVLDLCLKLGADRYLFGKLGRDYADVGAFERAGVEVAFQNYRHPVYPQLHGPFASHLSVVDLLFNCGPESLDILLQDGEWRMENGG